MSEQRGSGRTACLHRAVQRHRQELRQRDARGGLRRDRGVAPGDDADRAAVAAGAWATKTRRRRCARRRSSRWTAASWRARRSTCARPAATVAQEYAVLDFYRRHQELKPQGIAELNEGGLALARALARGSRRRLRRADARSRRPCLTCRSAKSASSPARARSCRRAPSPGWPRSRCWRSCARRRRSPSVCRSSWPAARAIAPSPSSTPPSPWTAARSAARRARPSCTATSRRPASWSDEVLARHGLPPPAGLRRPVAGRAAPAVDALAEAIAAEVDHLMAVRWSRTEGAILEADRDCAGRQHRRPAPAARASRSPPCRSTGRRSRSWRCSRSWSWPTARGCAPGGAAAGADHGHGAGLQRDPGGRRGAVGAGGRPGLAGLLRRQGRRHRTVRRSSWQTQPPTRPRSPGRASTGATS